MFAGLQNYECIETESYANIFWDQHLYSTKLKFFMLEEEEEDYQTYFQGSRDKVVTYADWTRCLRMNTFSNSATLTLTTFFLSNSLDIPQSFKRIRSLMQPTSITVFTKLSSMLMRHGRKTLIDKSLTYSLINLLDTHALREASNYVCLNWRFLYQVFTTWKLNNFSETIKKAHPHYTLKYLEIEELDDQHSTSLTKYSSPTYVFSNVLPIFLSNYKPIFSFYVKKVSKLKWKHSRGKSGRYTIKWKYIPVYKRLIVLIRWLVNDIQFQNHYNFHDRLFTSLKNLWFNPSSHLIIQFRRFVHKYVFQRCKNTLMLKFHSEV